MALKTWEQGFQKIDERIYAYITNGQLMLSNICLVVGDKEAVLFDVLCSQKKTEEFIAECRKYTDKPIKYLVISHPHGDHFMGANAVKGATVIGYKKLKEAFELDEKTHDFNELQKKMPYLDFAGATRPYPNIYVSGDFSLDLGNRMVEFRYMGKCHTDCDITMYVPDCKFMAGADFIFRYIAPPSTAGDIDHWLEKLHEVLDSDAEKFLPGHGPLAGKEAIEDMICYFERIKQQAQDVIDGKVELDDNNPVGVERELIENGWAEAARSIFSTEQYVSKLKGEEYKVDLFRALSVEKSRK